MHSFTSLTKQYVSLFQYDPWDKQIKNANQETENDRDDRCNVKTVESIENH